MKMDSLIWRLRLKRIKELYILAAFAGSLILYLTPGGIRVLAQVRDFALESKVEIQKSKVEALSEKQGEIEHHLENTDKQVQIDSNRISVIQGVGAGVLGLLGALQILGLVAQVKAK